MTPQPRRSPWFVLICIFAAVYFLHRDFGFLRLRIVFIPLAFAAAWTGIRAWRNFPTTRDRRIIAIGVLASMLAAAAPALVWGVDTFTFLQNVLPHLIGWSAVLWYAHTGQPSPVAEDRDGRPHPAWVWGSLGAVVAGYAVIHLVIRGNYGLIIDEVHYVLQSTLFDQASYSRPIESGLQDFFSLKYTAQRDGRLFTQYPPGFPAILAVFNAVGLRWWTNVIMGAAAVGLTYLIGRRVGSQRTGAVAAFLLTTCSLFVSNTGLYFAHVPAAATLLFATWGALRGEDATGGARIGWWCVAGASLGLTVAIRPLTGVAMGAAVVAWMLIRYQRASVSRLAFLATLVAGAAPFALWILHHNLETTGDILRFGYSAANGSLTNLGFGFRGEVRYDAAGQAVEWGSMFTLRHAARTLFGRVLFLVSRTPEVAIVIPLVTAVCLANTRVKWATAVPFVLLPASHFFYFWPSPRFLIELLPFWFLGIATLLSRLEKRNADGGRYILAFVIWSNVVALGMSISRMGNGLGGLDTYLESVEQIRRDHGKVVVFVKHNDDAESFFHTLYWFNARDFFGDVIVARDLGVRNELLRSRFSEHIPFVIEWKGLNPTEVFLRPGE